MRARRLAEPSYMETNSMKSSRMVCIFVLALCACWSLGLTQALGQAVAPTSDIKIDGEYGSWRHAWMPPDISEHGADIDQLIAVLHWFMAILFVGWGIFFVYCLVRFRQRSGQSATAAPIKAKPAKLVELAVVVFEAVLLLGFAIPIWAMVKNDIPPPTDKDVFRVRVVAEQFAWNFHYPGPDGEFGRIAPEYLDSAANPIGLDPGDPLGADDVVAGELHFPVNKTVVAELSSKDVIHCLSLPVLRIKQDIIPGMRIPVWFKATETGNYEVACAQLCGNNHYSMRAIMTVEPSEAETNRWIESQRPEEFDEDELD